MGGMALALPVLDAMGAEVTGQIPRRFCAIYTANGMSLPKAEHELDGVELVSRRRERTASSPSASRPSRSRPSGSSSASWAGCTIPNGPKADPHVCSDMWLTGAPLQNPKPGRLQLRRTRSGGRAAHQAVLPAAFAGALDRRRDGLSLAHRHDFVQPGWPADSRRRTIRAASSTACSAATARRCKSEHEKLQRRIKLVDAVAESARSLDQQLGKTDRERMDQYLTSLERSGIAADRLRALDRHPAEEAGLLASESRYHERRRAGRVLPQHVRPDRAGVRRRHHPRRSRSCSTAKTAWASAIRSRSSSGLSKTHHNLSHATDKEGQLQFAKYDLFLSQRIAHFLETPERVSGPQRQRARQHHRAVRQRRQHDAQSSQPADADRRRRQHGPQARDLLARKARRGCRTST